MAPIDSGSLVLVTGGNGFIAAHCIATLLRSGYKVRATVRSAEKGDSTRESLSAAGVSVSDLGGLEFVVVPDPTDLQSLSSALQDCQAVLHLASAFNYDAVPAEFEEKLMMPALKGTQVVCEAAAQQSTVRRVVIMSSFASVYDASLGLQPGRVYTEEDWCPLTYEDGVNASAVPIAYRASKVVAERAAWDYVRDHQVNYQLVTLCPGMVFGKMIHPISSLDGEIPPTKAPVWVDVEDLAEASMKVLSYPAASHDRFLVTQASYDTQEIADVVRAQLPDRHQAPLGEPGNRLAHTHYSCDSSKAEKVLGLKFKGLKESIIPLAEQLYDMAKL
ncbi:hypothetical protein N7481_002844 [Penicillium waksmanii]|uniref:uncharacterized protein n=1 Tax=Penicillium waksmanii TaxID=69791 RepID=UPI0025470FD7|nr:uncharacterized protein N7481_002844 [Penicillium waksmanii]KAJ5995867.1 hypothetical protein N7481_002844 [Penicillium waksmanii]